MQVLGALFAKRPNSAEAPDAAAGARWGRMATLSEEAPVLPGDPSSADAGTGAQQRQSPFEASTSSHDGSPSSEPAGSKRSSGAMASPFEPAAAFVPDESSERLTVGEMSRQHRAYQAQQVVTTLPGTAHVLHGYQLWLWVKCGFVKALRKGDGQLIPPIMYLVHASARY